MEWYIVRSDGFVSAVLKITLNESKQNIGVSVTRFLLTIAFYSSSNIRL